MINDIVIIAGGPSVKEFDITNRDLRNPSSRIIGVNDSGVLAKCDIVLTMDRLWLENRIDRIRATEGLSCWARRDVLKNIQKQDDITKFECDYKSVIMSTSEGRLNGTNSGFCAINLAYQTRPAKVYLLGFDMCRNISGEPYWYPSYNWAKAKPEGNTSDGKYLEWARQFVDIKKQFDDRKIEIINVTTKSNIDCFRKITFKEFMKERNYDTQ